MERLITMHPLNRQQLLNVINHIDTLRTLRSRLR